MIRFFVFIFSLLFIHPLTAQQKRVDSLLAVIRQNKGDAQTFAAFKKLGSLFEKEKPNLAISYYRHALQFPFRTTYAKDFIAISNSLGNLYYTHGQYDSSDLFHREALSLAKSISLEDEVAKAYQGIALNFLMTSKNDSARAYFQQALDLYIKLKEPVNEANVYVGLGNVFLEERIYPESLNQFIKAANLFEGAAHDSTGLARAWLNIANIENILEQRDKALDYLSRALKIAEAKKNDAHIAYCRNLSGRILRKKKKYAEALKEYKLAETIYRKRGDVRNEAEIIFAQGNVYTDLQENQHAIANYTEAIGLAKKINNTVQLAYAFSALGQAYHNMSKNNLALNTIDSSEIYARLTENKYLEMDAYDTKSKIFRDLKNYERALFFREKYADLKEQITKDENREATSDLEAKYQNSQKQSEIELLQKDRELKNVSLKQSRTVQTALVATVVLLVIIGLLVFSRNKTINQAKRLMEIERMRNQIARDLHDDMGSTLSSINLLSQVAQSDESENGQEKKYFKQIGDQSAKMMESMSDMVWSINPDNDNIQKTIAKMKEFSAEILEPKNIGYQFQVEGKLNDISLDVAKRKNLFLVFKEAINNAAKYSEGNFIDISFSQTVNNLLLVIRDNGKGFDSVNAVNGNGLKNMKQRAGEIGGTFSIHSSSNSGTSLTLNIPLT